MAESAIAFEPASEVVEEDLLPRVLPVGWQRIEAPGPAFVCQGAGSCAGLMVLFSAGTEEDGQLWLHVSASRRGRVPTWEDLAAVKRLFLGERWAYQVFAPEAEHYSLPERPGTRSGFVLHLWARADGAPVLPNFLRARGGAL